MTDWGIPSLRADRLSSLVPTRVYAGGLVADPMHALFLWRTYSLTQAQGMTVGFYVWDDKLDGLWRDPERQTARFLAAGVAAVIEPDFSLWADDPLIVQAYNVYRTRWMGRYWQEHGLSVIPSLSWSEERSFSFAFAGIPQYPPVVAVECRTAGQTDEDRRAFLTGLAEGVRHVQPEHVLVYGGAEHYFWLESRLPPGPQYTLLESWTHCRDRMRQREALRRNHTHQLPLFTGGVHQWADEVQVVAALAAAHA